MSDLSTEESYEMKEEEGKGFFSKVDPTLLKIITLMTVGLVFYLHYFTDASRDTKFAVVGIGILLLIINSRQTNIGTKELTCEDSKLALDRHIKWLGRRDAKYYKLEVLIDADRTEINDTPKYWLHTVRFKKRIGMCDIDEWYLGKTEAFTPANPRLFKLGRRPTPEDLREIKEYLLSPKHEALKSKGLLKESVMKELIGGR